MKKPERVFSKFSLILKSQEAEIVSSLSELFLALVLNYRAQRMAVEVLSAKTTCSANYCMKKSISQLTKSIKVAYQIQQHKW